MENGLRAEVAERVARGEVNDVPVRSSRSMGEIVRANVFTRFNAIIGVLWLIMLFVAVRSGQPVRLRDHRQHRIGIIQEWRAKKTLDSLAVIGEAKPTVRRDGVPPRSHASRSCSDDLIEIGPGDKVVVDGVVRRGRRPRRSTSRCSPARPTRSSSSPATEVMSGSFVVAGRRRLHRATKVGREAYAAQLAEEASRFTLVHSELRSGISRSSST